MFILQFISFNICHDCNKEILSAVGVLKTIKRSECMKIQITHKIKIKFSRLPVQQDEEKSSLSVSRNLNFCKRYILSLINT
jgi:hypothetical protein